jgi:hypothetical protein
MQTPVHAPCHYERPLPQFYNRREISDAETRKEFPCRPCLCVALFVPISFHAGLYAQSRSKQSQVVSQAESVAPKLTPEQKRGLRLLKAAEGESAGLQRICVPFYCGGRLMRIQS